MTLGTVFEVFKFGRFLFSGMKLSLNSNDFSSSSLKMIDFDT